MLAKEQDDLQKALEMSRLEQSQAEPAAVPQIDGNISGYDVEEEEVCYVKDWIQTQIVA